MSPVYTTHTRHRGLELRIPPTPSDLGVGFSPTEQSRTREISDWDQQILAVVILYAPFLPPVQFLVCICEHGMYEYIFEYGIRE